MLWGGGWLFSYSGTSGGNHRLENGRPNHSAKLNGQVVRHEEVTVTVVEKRETEIQKCRLKMEPDPDLLPGLIKLEEWTDHKPTQRMRSLW